MKMRYVKKKGIVIIVSFVFLAILSSVGIAFLWFSRLEKHAQENFISHVKVQLVAQSGAEFAISRLQDLAQKRAWDAIYEEGGKKSIWSYPLEAFEDANNNGQYEKGENVYEDFDGDKQYGIPRITAISEPSFANEHEKILVNGKEIGYSSGAMYISNEGKFFSGYILKVRDAHSMIYINGPVVVEGESVKLADYVVNMLNRLGDIVSYPDGTTFNVKAKELGKIEKLGNRISTIIAKAKDNHIPHKFMLQDKSFLPEDNLRFEKEEYDLIKEYITSYAWIDTAVINPAAFDAFTDAYGSGEKAPYTMLKTPKSTATTQRSSSYLQIQDPEFKVQHSTFNFQLSTYGMCPPIIKGVNCTQPGKKGTPFPGKKVKKEEKDTTTDILLDKYGSEDDEPPFHKVNAKFVAQYPDYSLLLQERAPVNINTAVREVLIVVLENLKGWYFDRKQRTFVNPGRYKETAPISLSQAIRLADHIIAYRRKQPFVSWIQFERFINGMESDDKFDTKYIVSGGLDPRISFLDPYQKQVILSNANPNTRMGDFNPDATYNAFFTDYVGKNKLLYHTTEFTFSSMGYYEIESLGFAAKKLDKKAVTNQAIPVEILGQYSLTYDVRLFEVYRHTTQRDFTTESVQWINGKKSTIKSRPATSLVVSYPENLANLGKLELIEGEYRLKLPKNAPAIFDGYLSIAPKVDDLSSDANLYTFYNSFTNSFQPEVAQFKGEVRGQADEKRSVIDTFAGKGIFPPGRYPVPGYNVNIAHLTRSSLYNDGYFAHESLRYPYEYRPQPNAVYGWSSKGSRRVIDEYLGYPEGKGKEESGIWNIGKTGAIEFWFKPTWDLEEQKDSDKDTRTFFSVGDAEGVWEETIIEETPSATSQPAGLHACTKWAADIPTLTYIKKFASGVSYGDPAVVAAMQGAYRITKLIGEEILFPKPDEWGKWLALKAFVEQRKSGGFSPSYAERRSYEAAKRLNEIMYYQSDDVKQQMEEKYNKIMNIGFPEERLVIFARNRKIAAFVGNNYAEESGVDDFGNFKTAAVPLFKEDWKRGTWHHILMVWTPTSQDDSEEVEVVLYVDGKPTNKPYKSTALIRNEINTMFFGTNRYKKNVSNGYPLTADGTIGGFKIYKNVADAMNNLRMYRNDRFWGRREGKNQIFWSAIIAQFPDGKHGRLGTISWSERIPNVGGNVLNGGDVMIKVVAINDKGEEDEEYVYPNDDSVSPIGYNGKENCQCVNEFGVRIYHPDSRFCPSQTGGGFPFMHLNERYKQSGKNKKKFSGLKYYIYFKAPRTVPISATPILEDITITFITKAEILKVHQVMNELK